MNKEATQRKRAVGTEAAKLERRILRAIAAAGDAGILQKDLVAKLELGEKVVRRLLVALRDPDNKRIYIARWRLVCANYCGVFVIGNLPDEPKPEAKTTRAYYYREGPMNAEALAKKDIVEAHRRWLATWVPHRDPAAAWIGRAAA